MSKLFTIQKDMDNTSTVLSQIIKEGERKKQRRNSVEMGVSVVAVKEETQNCVIRDSQ